METVEEILEMAQMGMDDAIERLVSNLEKIQAGKATPLMLKGIVVDYYGVITPLSQVANVSAPDSRTLIVKPWEKKVIYDIEKALFAANLGYTPQSDGEQIRLNIPMLTQERRKDLAKQIKAEGETTKISLRNTRQTANNSIKKLGKENLSEDLAKETEETVQKMVNKFVDKVDKIVLAKEEQVLTV